jgi:hypothetical protein
MIVRHYEPSWDGTFEGFTADDGTTWWPFHPDPRILRAAIIAPPPATATPSAHTVFVDGQPKGFRAFLIGGSNFFMLRDIAYALNGTPAQFNVEWDAARNAISLRTGRPYDPVGGEMAPCGGAPVAANPSTVVVYVDRQRVDLRAYNIAGNNFFMLRDLGAALGFGVDWGEAAQAVLISTG